MAVNLCEFKIRAGCVGANMAANSRVQIKFFRNKPFISLLYEQTLPTSNRASSQRSRRNGSAKAATAAAGVRSPRPENVSGDFFVDHTCIDCDTCRWMAPEVFSRMGDMSAVHHQPEGKEERFRGLQVREPLLLKPVGSITSLLPSD